MPYTYDPHDEILEDEALEVLVLAVPQLEQELRRALGRDPTFLSVSVDITAGSRGQPVVVVDLRVDLDEDFAIDDWPRDEVESLKAQIRDVVADSVVAFHDWVISVGTRARGAA